METRTNVVPSKILFLQDFLAEELSCTDKKLVTLNDSDFYMT